MDTYPQPVLAAPLTWPDLPALQQPEWPDAAARDAAIEELRSLPPLVFAGECDELRDRLAAVARGEAFVLQGGDCAETFADVRADVIRAKLKTVLQMAVVLTYGAALPVVKVGRLAGQYGKPRSKAVEVRDGVELPAYRGDMVNGLEFAPGQRRPDPQRLVEAYHRSSATLNLVRAFTQGGYADLRQVHDWNKDFVRDSRAGQRYERMAGEIDRALTFMHACGVDPEEFKRVEFFAGHEALVLDYERALTRVDSRSGLPYDVSGHFVWVGERTRQLDGAHIDFAARIRNPIGLKVGPTVTPDDLLALVERLDPDREPGRLTLIARMGAGRVREALPPLDREGRRRGPRDRLGLRPHARQHDRVLGRGEDPALRRGGRRGARLLRGAPLGRHAPRRAARRAHRRRRHRVRGRRRGHRGAPPGRAVRDGVRPAAEPRAVAGAGVPRRGHARVALTACGV